MPYEFSWAVKDEPSANDYTYQEKSKRRRCRHRILPTSNAGRIVTYCVHGGFVQEVKYKGEAKPCEPTKKQNRGANYGSSAGSAQSGGYVSQSGSFSY